MTEYSRRLAFCQARHPHTVDIDSNEENDHNCSFSRGILSVTRDFTIKNNATTFWETWRTFAKVRKGHIFATATQYWFHHTEGRETTLKDACWKNAKPEYSKESQISKRSLLKDCSALVWHTVPRQHSLTNSFAISRFFAVHKGSFFNTTGATKTVKSSSWVIHYAIAHRPYTGEKEKGFY